MGGIWRRCGGGLVGVVFKLVWVWIRVLEEKRIVEAL